MGTPHSILYEHHQAHFEEASSPITVNISALCCEHSTIKHGHISLKILYCR